MTPEMTMINGNPFPVYQGEALSWSLGLYSSLTEERAGYPRARVVIAAMREHRPGQLDRERYELLRGSFDRMFGQNAKRLLNVIEEEDAKV